MLPERIGEAAKEGDLETIRAYFEDDSNGERDVDDVCESENSIMWRTLMTPLMWCAAGDGDRVTRRNVEVAGYLLTRGASIDEIHTGHTALLVACYCGGGTVTEMIELLLSAGANPNFRNQSGESGRTPLSAHVRFCRNPSVECVTALLRAGASLDRVYVEYPFEYHFPADINYRHNEPFWRPIRALAAGVRRHGSLKSYLREPHREVLLLRGLAMRGHLAPKGTRRTRRTQKWTAAAAFLARLGDNGVVWNVLSFWRATK